jgi:hypothetical protein
MDFIVEFYETVAGSCPVREFLDQLKASDPGDFAAVVAGLAKLRNRQYHREPLSKALGNGLFELRHVGKLNSRIIWFFMKNRRIVALHMGFVIRDSRSLLATWISHGNGCMTGRREQNREKNQLRQLSGRTTTRPGVC